ncbi:ribonuclease H1 isoform X2 [Megalopta genalis]|uniref:ribonuclease H1 isoform X2 n=1 Tax=Megalopta genalis TaxID=115081 RepID=UPI003FD49824
MPAAYYAVAKGHQPGIYGTWDECKAQVHQYPGAIFKKFPSQKEAESFIREKTSTAKGKVNSAKKETKNIQTLGNIISARKRSLPAIDKHVKEKLPRKKIKLIGISDIPSTSTEQTSSSKFTIDDDGYVNVYTDGACSSNGYKNAQAGLGVWFGQDHPLNVSQPVVGRATNNNAEIQAVTMAARKAKEAGIEKLKIITDSKFLIKCITEWMPKWKKNGWKTANGNPVINKLELLEMEEALKSLKIAWKHVNGHVGIHGNEMADKLARAGCSK